MDVTITSHLPESFPKHLDFMERIIVTRGTVEDWHSLKDLHYKTDGKPFAPSYYKAELDGRLIGVMVMAFPNCFWRRATACFRLKPTTNTTVANQFWGARLTRICGRQPSG
jgi:ABC-type ATPase with predicted acetyltransferase domain